MTKTELNEECARHGTCKTCQYKEWKTYGEYGCSIKDEDLEEEK